MPQHQISPADVVLDIGPGDPRRVALSGEPVVVGRAPECQIRLDDPHVSRRHAALVRQGGSLWVEDLASSGGTYVNGLRVTGRHPLVAGDVLRFGSVEARYDAQEPVTQQLPAPASQPRPRGTRRRSAPVDVRYDIDRQQAETVNNVARDQYNAYVQHVVEQRDSFLREIAAARTRARWLIWTGLLLFVGGFATFAAGILRFIGDVSSGLASGDVSAPESVLGPEVAGIPAGALGWAAAALGALLILVGSVLHVVTTSRRKRLERELPVPAWVPSQETGGLP